MDVDAPLTKMKFILLKTTVGVDHGVQQARKYLTVSPMGANKSISLCEQYDVLYEFQNRLRQVKSFHVAEIASVNHRLLGEWVESSNLAIHHAAKVRTDDTSEELACFLAEAQPTLRQLLNSLANGAIDSGLEKVDLTKGGRFLEQIANAIVMRIPVGFYQQHEFVIKLCADFTQAVKNGQIKHAWWDVVNTSEGVLSLRVYPEKKQTEYNAGEGPWKRARPIRFSNLAPK